MALQSSKTFFMPRPSLLGVHIFFGFQFFQFPSIAGAVGSYAGLSTHCPPAYSIHTASGVSLLIFENVFRLCLNTPRKHRICTPYADTLYTSDCNLPPATVHTQNHFCLLQQCHHIRLRSQSRFSGYNATRPVPSKMTLVVK